MTERSGKGKSKRNEHSQDTAKTKSTWSKAEPAADNKWNTWSKYEPASESRWKPTTAAEGKVSVSTWQATPASASSSRAAVSTLSSQAAAFVPGQQFSADAAAFVPSVHSTAFAPSSHVEEFVPGTSAWSSAEFVPGQTSWSGTPANSQIQTHWQPSNYAGAFEQATSLYSGSQFANVSAVPFASGAGTTCMFDFDAYSTESSSCPSPRDDDRPVAAAGPAVSDLKADDAEASACKPNDSVEDSSLKKTTDMLGLDDPSEPPSIASSPPFSPAQPSSGFQSPATGPSPMLEAKTAIRFTRLASEDATSENEVEDFGMAFSLPPAEEPADCPIVEAAVMTERSDRNFKQWLQRFASDNDTEFFDRQWQAWTANGSCDTRQEIAEWLLRYGLEDCRAAAPVTAAVDFLLKENSIPRSAVQMALAEYSEEDLEDLTLDNPKATDFVAAVQNILAKQDFGMEERCQPATSSSDMATPLSNGTATYTHKLLLQVRNSIARSGEIEKHSGPRWTTETASKLFAPMPSWQQQRNTRGSSSAGVAGAQPTGEVGEWREAQKRNSEARAKQRDEKGAKKPGRQKEASMQVSETSWMAQSKRWKAEKGKEELEEDAIVDEQFLREMRLTLNKLTVEKFDSLSDHLIHLISQSSRPNRGIPVLMQLVFEKATTQHHFIDMYVNLCVKLHKWLMAHNDIVRVESQTNFKRILLNQCQNSFEQYLEPPGSLDGISGDALYEAQVKYKTKMLGNIKLVGQLIRHGMLSPKIALSVSNELVQDDPMVREERLETLAVFLETIGPSLDDPKWTHAAEFEKIFNEVVCLSNDRTVKSRIRFLLRDVVDMRRGNWQNSKMRAFDAAAPSTIAEVHEQAKQNQTSGKSMTKSGTALTDSPQKTKKRSSAGGMSSTPAASSGEPTSQNNGSEPSWRGKQATTPKTRQSDSTRRFSGETGTAAVPSSGSNWMPKSRPAQPAEQISHRNHAAASPKAKMNENLLAGLQKAVAGAATRATKPKEEILALFHKEITQIIRKVGNGINIGEGVQRLRECSLPSECVLEEAVDLIARMVDEPRERRQQVFPLLRALFDAGVFSPPGLLGKAVTTFIEDAFADPGNVDPPDLVDIIMRELLPALGLALNSLSITPCIADLFAELDDGG